MASSKGTRILGIVILVACVVVLAGGAWFFFGRDLFLADDSASDDEPDEIEQQVDGGTRHVHRPGKHHGKGGATGHKGANGAHAAGGAPAPAGKSYEAAIAGNREQVSIGAGNGAPDLTDAQLGGPMRNATFLGACGAPDSMHVTVKVAIRGGRAVGVSVYTAPPNPQIAGCVDRSVRNLAWPVNGKMDSFVTTY